MAYLATWFNEQRGCYEVHPGQPLNAGRLVDDVRLPAKVKRIVRSAEQARKKAQRAERVASEKIREATVELGKLGMSLREVGTVLGVSRQRAQQLARK